MIDDALVDVVLESIEKLWMSGRDTATKHIEKIFVNHVFFRQIPETSPDGIDRKKAYLICWPKSLCMKMRKMLHPQWPNTKKTLQILVQKSKLQSKMASFDIFNLHQKIAEGFEANTNSKRLFFVCIPCNGMS